jgi:hypothetical protein
MTLTRKNQSTQRKTYTSAIFSTTGQSKVQSQARTESGCSFWRNYCILRGEKQAGRKKCTRVYKKNENKNKESASWYHDIRFPKIEAAVEVNDNVTRFSFKFPK